MSKMQRHLASFAVVATLAAVAYVWTAIQPGAPSNAIAADFDTSVLGAAREAAPVPIWDAFEPEKKAAPAHELPPQF